MGPPDARSGGRRSQLRAMLRGRHPRQDKRMTGLPWPVPEDESHPAARLAVLAYGSRNKEAVRKRGRSGLGEATPSKRHCTTRALLDPRPGTRIHLECEGTGAGQLGMLAMQPGASAGQQARLDGIGALDVHTTEPMSRLESLRARIRKKEQEARGDHGKRRRLHFKQPADGAVLHQ